MSPRKVLLLIVALLIAGLTVILARSMISSGQTSAAMKQAAVPTKEILVAAKDLSSGSLLQEADVKWHAWPAEGDTEGYVLKGQDDKAEYIGTVVRYGMRAGEPIMMGRVVKPGQRGFMAAALAPGMRAVSISISPVAGVAGFVFPGDHVDVLVTHSIDQGKTVERSERKVSETILSNVRVLALDQKMGDQVTEPKVAQIATLEVTSKQAEALALASEMGTLSLALRSIAMPEKTADGENTQTVPEEVTDEGPSLTWDSDVSRVLPGPANRRGATQKITIIRGNEISETVHDLTSPQGAQ